MQDQDIQQEILDSCLLSLMDNHEAPKGHNNWVTLSCSIEEREAVQEFRAYQVAQGWMVRTFGDGLRLTEKGYLQHLPRARFLRTKGVIAS